MYDLLDKKKLKKRNASLENKYGMYKYCLYLLYKMDQLDRGSRKNSVVCRK